jgi:hypothetical protein
MIDREYAISPDPQPWAPQTITYEEDVQQKVGKGKNAHIIRTTRKSEIEYRVISFDVSTPASRHERTPQEARPDEEKHANWLTIHGKEELIYKRVRFENIERHYSQHPRLLAKCEQMGGKFSEMDGDILREYLLEIHPDGKKTVVSRLVPFAKYIPMLREKAPTIKRVIASAYEKKEE